MVGLSLANQLLERKISQSITILEKESKIGLHSSGRNSGVIHAGVYYKPHSLKARVCVSGAKRLKHWIKQRGLPLNPCGKVIVPTRRDLDNQLDLLANRAAANGANVSFWNKAELKKHIPEAETASNRALWSPDTAVVKPQIVLTALEAELKEKGVIIIKAEKKWEIDPELSQIRLSNNSILSYAHFINCAGLQADRLAKKFGVGLEYSLIPFKGVYWQIRQDCSIKIPSNLYPVPDLNVPFLGVHFTPSADELPTISIGPTATFSFGRENYLGIKGLEPMMSLNNARLLFRQYINNKDGFRGYFHNQAFLSVPNCFLNAARELIPSIEMKHIEPSKKVGIRAQLFNHRKQALEDDFLCLSGKNSTHIMNAISPAFTASFELADLILEQSNL